MKWALKQITREYKFIYFFNIPILKSWIINISQRNVSSEKALSNT